MVLVSNVTSSSLDLAWEQPAYFADQIHFEEITYKIIVEGKTLSRVEFKRDYLFSVDETGETKQYDTTSLGYHIEDLDTATNYQIKIIASYPEMTINADQGESFKNQNYNCMMLSSLEMKESLPSSPVSVLTAPNAPSLDPILEVCYDGLAC